MLTSNIHEITKKETVSIAVKIITSHLLRTIWYNISNIEIEKPPSTQRDKSRWGHKQEDVSGEYPCSPHYLTITNPMPTKKAESKLRRRVFKKLLVDLFNISAAKVPNDPFESTFITAEQIEPSTYEASYSSTFYQFFSAL